MTKATDISNGATATKAPEAPYRMPKPLMVFTACIIGTAAVILSISVKDIASCRGERSEANSALQSLRQAAMGGASNSADITVVETKIKSLVGRCGA